MDHDRSIGLKGKTSVTHEAFNASLDKYFYVLFLKSNQTSRTREDIIGNRSHLYTKRSVVLRSRKKHS